MVRGWHNESARHALAARGIPTTVRVRRQIPSHELSDVRLVQRIKAMYPGKDKQSLYGRFVQERNLKPGIDAKEFYEIYDMVGSDLHIEDRNVDFKPTHKDKNTGALVMVWLDENGIYHLVTDYGGTGTCPPFMFKDAYEEL